LFRGRQVNVAQVFVSSYVDADQVHYPVIGAFHYLSRFGCVELTILLTMDGLLGKTGRADFPALR